MVERDLPDWTRKVIIEYTGGFIGLEELAARLGTIVPWDLKGNVVLMEDFETEETEWTLDEGGGASLASRVSRQKWSGNWSIKLLVDDVADAYAEAARLLHLPGLSKYGQFVRVRWDEDLGRIIFRNSFTINGTDYYCGVRYTLPTTTLEIETGADVWTEIDDDLTIGSATAVWYPILLTYDLETELYDKLVIAEHEYDLSSYSMGVV